MAFQILNDPAQKYGRNVTIAAGVILVLALAPGIDIVRFKPLGFEFKPGSKGKLSTWYLLLGVLVYYYFRFCVDARIDYLGSFHQRRIHWSNRKSAKKNLRNSRSQGDGNSVVNQMNKYADVNPWIIEVRNFGYLILALRLPIFCLLHISLASRSTPFGREFRDLVMSQNPVSGVFREPA